MIVIGSSCFFGEVGNPNRTVYLCWPPDFLILFREAAQKTHNHEEAASKLN